MKKALTKKEITKEISARRKLEVFKTLPAKAVFEKERKKHRKYDESQKDLRKQPIWREFAKEKGIEPENLLIGSVPDEDELNKKETAWLKREVEKSESGYVDIVFDVKPCPNDRYLTLTLDTQARRYIIHSLIDNELDKYLKGKEIRKPNRTMPAKDEMADIKEGKKAYNLCHGKSKTFTQATEERYKISKTSNSFESYLKKLKRNYDKYRKLLE